MEALERTDPERLWLELHARQGVQIGRRDRPVRDDALQDASTTVIYQVHLRQQKALYGRPGKVDTRLDIYQVSEGDLRVRASAVALLADKKTLVNLEGGCLSLHTVEFGTSMHPPLCRGERFFSQPSAGFGTAFLVASDKVLTAGHCVHPKAIDRLAVIFGHVLIDPTTQAPLLAGDVRFCANIIQRTCLEDGSDYCLLKLSEPVTHLRPLVLSRTVPALGTPLYVIGHPCGLPKKFAGDAEVKQIDTAKGYFSADLDTFGGNSGSPVFSAISHDVVGILVRGEPDFVLVGDCQKSLIVPVSRGQQSLNWMPSGEHCTLLTPVLDL
jgi:hypothetical protein